jgi:hypothetical protein
MQQEGRRTNDQSIQRHVREMKVQSMARWATVGSSERIKPTSNTRSLFVVVTTIFDYDLGF